jgi:UDP-2,3-diacylglucosamine hydrolase
MLGTQLVVVSDAHLGASRPEDDDALLEFLDQVPHLGDCLLVNGDLFDFWFAYRRTVPRTGFRVAAALTALRRRIPVVMTGGNHDRWGDSFWSRDAGIEFAPDELRFEIGGSAVVALHGDGVAEEHRAARVMHRITKHPLTVALYRWLHPDLGIWLVDRMSGRLADSTRDPAVLDRAQHRQADFARSRMEADSSIETLIMAHTHRPQIIELFPGRRFVNPGAWIEGRRYALVSQSGAELKAY